MKIDDNDKNIHFLEDALDPRTWIEKEKSHGILPKVGESYEYYDNGVVSTSHGMNVKVLEVIPYSDAPIFLKEIHRLEVEESPKLYSKSTDFFVSILIGDYDVDVLARTKDGGWIGGLVSKFYGGRLDLDGSLFEKASGYKKYLKDKSRFK